MTREEWAIQFLAGIGAPPSKANRIVIVSWIQAEGGTAKWNPLNTTHEAPGATDYNWVGVKNYPSYAAGLKATVDTLNYGADRGKYGYGKIRHCLQTSASPRRTLRAIESSEWGTGGLAYQCRYWVKKSWETYRNMPINQ